jgi:hypothetical protein
MLINTNGNATALRFLNFHGKVSLVSLECIVLNLFIRDYIFKLQTEHSNFKWE